MDSALELLIPHFLVVPEFFLMLEQKVKTRVIKNNRNPQWDDELTLSIKDVNSPIHLVSTKPNCLTSSVTLLLADSHPY